MYYTVIKHSGHLKTLEKCRKHSPAGCVFCTSLVFSNARRVLSRLRLLYLLHSITMPILKFFDTLEKLDRSFTNNSLIFVSIEKIYQKLHVYVYSVSSAIQTPRISLKLGEFRQTYSAARRRIFNSLLGVWISQ